MLEKLRIRLPANSFNDHPQQVVAGNAIRPAFARREIQRQFFYETEDLLGGRFAVDLSSKGWSVCVVLDPGRVGEQVAKVDLLPGFR